MSSVGIDVCSSVTVAVPVKDGGRFLGDCLRSLQNQNCVPAEIIVVDDGSIDNTVNIAAELGVRVISHSRCKGLASARNTAVANCKTEYIAFIDADCIAHPDMLERLLQPLCSPDVAGCGGRGIETVKSDADLWRKRFMSQSHGRKIILKDWMIMGLCTLYRMSALRDVGGFSLLHKTHGEDVDIGIRLNKRAWRLVYRPDAMVRHLRTEGWEGLCRTAYRHQYGQAMARNRHDIDTKDQLLYGLKLTVLGPLYMLMQNKPVAAVKALFPSIFMIYGYYQARKYRKPENKTIFGHYPATLQVEVTTSCPLECRYCARRVLSVEPVDICDESLEIIREYAPFARMIVLGGWGEPLAGSRLDGILSAINSDHNRQLNRDQNKQVKKEQNKPWIRLITSGWNASETRAQELSDKGVDEVVLSMDHITDEGLQNLRTMTRADIIKAIEIYSKFMKLRIAATLSSDTIRLLPEFIHLASEYKAPLDVSALKVYDPELKDRNIYLYPEELSSALREARKLANQLNVNVSLPPEPDSVSECRQPLESLFLRADGSIYACCSAIFSNGTYGLMLKRSVKKNIEVSSDELPVFDDPEFISYREAQAGLIKYPVPCRNCAFRFADAKAHDRSTKK